MSREERAHILVVLHVAVSSDITVWCRSLGLPEICAYGFRNPWRCGFDRLTDELYCGDVGHTNVVSIDIIE